MTQIKDIITKVTVFNNKKRLGESDLASLIHITEISEGKIRDNKKLSEAILKVTGHNVSPQTIYYHLLNTGKYKKKPFEKPDLKKPVDQEFTGPIEELEARELHKSLGYHNPF